MKVPLSHHRYEDRRCLSLLVADNPGPSPLNRGRFFLLLTGDISPPTPLDHLIVAVEHSAMVYRLTLLAAFAILLIGPTRNSLAAKPPRVLAGTISKITDKLITVSTELGSETLEKEDDTVVVIDGATATWTELKVGQQAMVSLKGATNVATKVQVGAASEKKKKKKKS